MFEKASTLSRSDSSEPEMAFTSALLLEPSAANSSRSCSCSMSLLMLSRMDSLWRWRDMSALTLSRYWVIAASSRSSRARRTLEMGSSEGSSTRCP